MTVVGDERRLVPGDLLERAAAGLLLHGNAYVQLIADGPTGRRSFMRCGPSG